MNELLDTLTSSVDAAALPLGTILLTLLLAVTIGHAIGWVYQLSHQGVSYSQMFASSLVVMPVLVSLVMLLMADNLFIAFGLLAVFAVVRFRNVLKDTRDTTFILWAIVEGMAIGTQRFTVAVIGCVLVSLMFAYLKWTQFGGRHRFDAMLSIQLTGNLVEAVRNHRRILDRYSSRIQLANERRLSDAGLDLSYHVLLRDPDTSSEFLTELQATEGVEHVSLYRRDDESEF